MATESNHIDLLDTFEIGGSVFELIEFSLQRELLKGGTLKGTYGVNVAKVREVVRMPKINPLASRIPGIAGLFELRGVPIPAIHLNKVLGDHGTQITDDQQIIVTEFSQKRAGFIVQQTHRIRRVEWAKVLPPSAEAAACMSGMMLIENNEFLFILDLERILHNIEQQDHNTFVGTGDPERGPARAEREVQVITDPRAPGVLIVDDSVLIRNSLRQALAREGFRTMEAENGLVALKHLESFVRGAQRRFGSLNAVVTDVEMPLMDGLTLTAKIRENPHFADMPIILHTSLSGEATAAAAKEVGANGFVVKNDINALVSILKELLVERPFALGA